ncbi:MAG: hypothetical protein WCI75_18575, partial [candidate division NC10 bacterium]
MKGFAIGSIILALALAATASAADLAVWTFEAFPPSSAGPHTPESGCYTLISKGLGWHADPNSVYTNPVGNGSFESFSSDHWAIGDYYEFQTSTRGYTGIAITWHQTCSPTGPGTFNLDWSTDHINWTTLTPSYTVNPTTWTSATSDPNSIHGPTAAPAALDNKAVVYFRLVDQVAPTAVTGTNRVDNIQITGTATATTGACCAALTCTASQSPADCCGAGGIYQGNGTPCTPNPCSEMGACCVGQACSLETSANCALLGGTYQGPNTTCVPNTCLTCITIQDAKARPPGTAVVLCDVVISNDIDLISGGNTTMQVQELDSSAGLTLFTYNVGDITAILAVTDPGDSIRLWGTTASYNGLAELSPPYKVQYLGTVGVPAPVVVTAAELTANAEAYESMLIKVQ